MDKMLRSGHDGTPLTRHNSVDGASRDEKHVPPKYTGTEPKANIEGAKIYHGSCQCGAIGIAVKCKDLHGPEAANPVSCGCSICSRVSRLRAS